MKGGFGVAFSFCVMEPGTKYHQEFDHQYEKSPQRPWQHQIIDAEFKRMRPDEIAGKFTTGNEKYKNI